MKNKKTSKRKRPGQFAGAPCSAAWWEEGWGRMVDMHSEDTGNRAKLRIARPRHTKALKRLMQPNDQAHP